jgi:endogenous inhibitor of DNA gyrase (YacG/DUF329 family)
MATVVKCPVCRSHVVFEDNPFRPFCSERCKLIDLGAWAGEKYRIPGAPVEEDPAEETDEGSGDRRKRPN